VGLTQVLGLFLTHTDADHIGGALSLLTAIPVRHIYLPSRKIFSQNALGQSVLKLALAKGISIDTVTAGMNLEVAAGYEVKVLWPPPDTLIPGNDGSLVTHWTCLGATVLMTGDAGLAVESALLSRVAKGESGLQSDLLKVAHHGSRTASYAAFLNQVRPTYAVISCDSAVYGHPHPEAIARLNQVIQNTSHILRTDREGTLWFEEAATGGWARSNSGN
jgi:competence protein ComEC